MALFNVRVYGLLINNANQVLVSDEREYGMEFTKFPGGGLELGEGLIDGLKREFLEECNVEVEVINHFYTTDFYVKSAFNNTQVISVYYFVKALQPLPLNFKTIVFDFDGDGPVLQAFRWIDLAGLKPDHFTFEIDQHVAKLLTEQV